MSYNVDHPGLTSTIFISPADLQENSTLTTQIIALENTAFTRLHSAHASNWEAPTIRFPNPQKLFNTIGPSGVIALILDTSRTSAETPVPELVQVHDKYNKEFKKGKLVACALIVPWNGGWEKEGAATETGWEAKAVAVDEEERYLKKGIAIQLIADVKKYLIEKKKKVSGEGKGALTLWVLTGEELNGAYWRRRGFVEVRRKTWKKPTWDCLSEFDMVVLKRESDY
ncbi:hypothetical protein DM02DRAFT_604472 [Periconia macrospinosa]|uniref:N-acetyltransferase domain-containing protein n=1 Tax=Periconia macrospinosa TaxID=97972 RepID=A0A2V1D4Y7_9PLEO|nr:hypothetical protein DM02DRAFT_604472 [Periconia macrospinosa]